MSSSSDGANITSLQEKTLPPPSDTSLPTMGEAEDIAGSQSPTLEAATEELSPPPLMLAEDEDKEDGGNQNKNNITPSSEMTTSIASISSSASNVNSQSGGVNTTLITTTPTLNDPRDFLTRILDSASPLGPMAQFGGLNENMSTLLKAENAYEMLADCIVISSNSNANTIATSSTDKNKENISTALTETELERSYHAMKILSQSCENSHSNVNYNNNNVYQHLAGSGTNSYSILLNPTKAGLLSKTLFHANNNDDNASSSSLDKNYTKKHHGPHVTHLLKSMLAKYPGAVLSAACAGGKTAMETNLGPMLKLRNDDFVSSSLSLILFVDLVMGGCCPNAAAAAAGNQRTNVTPCDMLSKGHRRKFIRSLGDWGLVSNLLSIIESPPNDAALTKDTVMASDLFADAACDAFLTIAEGIAFPSSTNNNNNESFGEEALLKPLGEKQFVDRLVAICCSTQSYENSVNVVKDEEEDNSACSPPLSLQRQTVAAKVLLDAFKLCTGQRKSPPPPELSNPNAAEEKEPEIKLISLGITSFLFENIVASLPTIALGLQLIPSPSVNIVRDDDDFPSTKDELTVRHPGGNVVEQPFTARRLILVTLLTELIIYECDQATASNCSSAMDALLLPLHNNDDSQQQESKGEKKNEVDMGIWASLCQFFFAYPENNMYQVQFYRLLFAVLQKNHEKTLKLVIQQIKFLSLLIKGVKNPGYTHRGSILQCLNAIRLQSQSLSPKSWLRHYLESHDGWKAFLPTLTSMTIEQCQPTCGGINPQNVNNTEHQNAIMPAVSLDEEKDSDIGNSGAEVNVEIVGTSNESVKLTEIDIDLGSKFAADLGFDPSTVKVFVEDIADASVVDTSQTSAAKGGKKKGKKKKKKKKNKTGVGPASATNTDDDGEDKEGKTNG